jgi:hypothetical protein
VLPKKGGIADRKGIRFSGNPDATDYCEKHDARPLENDHVRREPGHPRDENRNVLDAPGRFLVDSLS